MTTTNNNQGDDSFVPLQSGEQIIDREIRAHNQFSDWLVADDYETLAAQCDFERRKVIAPLIKIREPLGAATAEIYARLNDHSDRSSAEINRAREIILALNEKFARSCAAMLEAWTPTPSQLARWQ